jgi:hypothetical protein
MSTPRRNCLAAPNRAAPPPAIMNATAIIVRIFMPLKSQGRGEGCLRKHSWQSPSPHLGASLMHQSQRNTPHRPHVPASIRLWRAQRPCIVIVPPAVGGGEGSLSPTFFCRPERREYAALAKIAGFAQRFWGHTHYSSASACFSQSRMLAALTASAGGSSPTL